MAVIVKNIKNNNLYVLLGTGFSYYKDSRPGAFGGNLIPHMEEGEFKMAAVCDKNGHIHWFETEALKVIKVDGIEVSSLFKDAEEEYFENKTTIYCPACGASVYEDDKMCGSCGITLIVDDEYLPKF